MENDEAEDHPKSGDGKGTVGSSSSSSSASLFRQAAGFVCATVGLVVLVGLYAAAGGAAFAYLERTNERSQCDQERHLYRSLLNDTLGQIRAIRAYYRRAADGPDAKDAFLRAMRQFRGQALSIGYDGSDCDAMGRPGGPPYQWSYANSLLFACTIFTTIGYGNIAPRTFWGRITSIAYAMVGIPLMLICLTNIGEFLSRVFYFVYTELFCFRCFRRRQRGKRPTAASGSNGSPGAHDSWKTAFHDHSGQSEAASNADRSPGRDAEEGEEEEDAMIEGEEKTTVPLTVTLVMMAWYVFFGALIFSVVEDWDWMQSGYYCFVTISTIGFGDVVPGINDLETTEGQLRMIGAAAYLLIGMALLSMTFNLLQEEMTEKMKWIGKKLQALKKNMKSRKSRVEPSKESVESAPDDLSTQPLQMIYLDDKKAYLSLAEYKVGHGPGVSKHVRGKERGKGRRQPIESLLPNLKAARHGGDGREGERSDDTASP